jgi:hypothetical protein
VLLWNTRVVVGYARAYDPWAMGSTWCGWCVLQATAIFLMFDTDGSGALSVTETSRLVHAMADSNPDADKALDGCVARWFPRSSCRGLQAWPSQYSWSGRVLSAVARRLCRPSQPRFRTAVWSNSVFWQRCRGG